VSEMARFECEFCDFVFDLEPTPINLMGLEPKCPKCGRNKDVVEIECEHAEVNVNENGFLYCEICGELVEDKVNQFM